MATDRSRQVLLATARTALLLGAACAATPPPVEQVLAGSADERCAAAVAASRAAPGDPRLALAAAHVLFETADLTVQQALVEHVRAAQPADALAVLAAEADLPESVRDRVLGLADAGAKAAEAALAALPDDAVAARVDAQVHLALHLSFVAWANGPMRSLMAGYGSRITTAMDAALALDPTWDHGAPLRLKGRFLAQAPWPLRDRDESLRLLRRAVEQAPLPLHHLFLGDLLCQRGDLAAAITEWQQVATSTPDDSTRAAWPWHVEMADLRLRAARQM